ncbi:mechanosensitive ion channel family protein [Halopenitus sp. POP-27]|uniref:mechanosensitive ion channel family protein n=1 Tax=Halopenitus sp. POP-27 TaxID=2994425 RepID=UPI00246976E4|nr:mechanosensitive ion channel family protein [Halopenitus sp. POP-27]
MGIPAQVAPIADVLAPIVGNALAETLASAIVFLAVVAIVFVGNRALLSPLVDRVLEERGVEPHARRPLTKIASIVVLFAGIAIAFGLAGYGSFLRSLATIAAAATLAIGFALQEVIRNFVAGVFIYTDRPFRIGDWVEWGGGDYSGVVEDISFRVTRIRTFDNELLTVPNYVLTSGVVKNPVAKDTLRLKFLFGIDYEDDIDRATTIIIEEAEKRDDILADPAPSVRLTELGDSFVGLQSRIWIDNPSRADFVRTRGEYVTAVKQRFDEEGISIPFPQRTVSGRGAWEEPPAFGDEA